MPIAVPLLLLAALVPGPRPSQHLVEVLVGACLVVLLFEGGLGIGPAKAREVARPALVLGLLGTLLTAAAMTPVVHLLVDTSWYAASLVAVALAPTDPAVVFAVLRGQQGLGRARTLLEAESGANDPVGIALLSALLAAGSLSGGALSSAAGEFALQLVVGTAVGVVGALLLRSLPPWPALAGAVGLFGVAVLAHGSGYLAVFVAGILLGDRLPSYRRLPALAETVAFVVLGLTVDVRLDAVLPGLGVAAALVLVRVVVGWPLLPGWARGERLLVLVSGLKGAVPLLLGSMLAGPLYGVVVVAVLASVVFQGGLLPRAAARLQIG